MSETNDNENVRTQSEDEHEQDLEATNTMFSGFSISSALGRKQVVDSEDLFVIPRTNGKTKSCLYKADLTAYLELMKDRV